MEALLGRISLDRVIWIESMAEEPAARHRSLAVRGGAGAGAGDLLHMTMFGRTQGGSSAPGFSVRRTVPRRCRSSIIVQDRIRDTSGTLVIGKVHKCLILLASPRELAFLRKINALETRWDTFSFAVSYTFPERVSHQRGRTTMDYQLDRHIIESWRRHE
jgi:hypothetical protein